ncbi:hypothetical protein HEK616_84580 (plasmid) [Streptomyces nigrescens]|uniref:Uncharacterized protein n=2 Tax=Streptomyces nigrescens TaxID=1920 RepID=A0ABN6RAJ5_STRNI|nr:hypothetical protein HEK616_84580 [Streptomyces nigrescens]
MAASKSHKGGVRACTEVKRVDADGRAVAERAAAEACSAQPGRYYADRHSYCLSDTRITYTLYDPGSGAATGVGEISLSSNAEPDANSGWWNEEFTATVTKTEGHVSSLAVNLTASCTNACRMINPDAWGTKVLVLRRSISSHVTYSSSPAKGTETMVTPQYSLKLYQPGDTPGDSYHNWSLPLKVRCDAELSGYGCVINQLQAVLKLPLSKYGEAAATYWYAQAELADHWGAPDNPLSRNKDEAAHKANRYRT